MPGSILGSFCNLECSSDVTGSLHIAFTQQNKDVCLLKHIGRGARLHLVLFIRQEIGWTARKTMSCRIPYI